MSWGERSRARHPTGRLFEDCLKANISKQVNELLRWTKKAVVV